MVSPTGLTSPALTTPRDPHRASPWASRDFRLLVVGSLAAVLGHWVQQIGQGWYVLQITGSAFDLTLVQAASALPMLLFGLLGGVVADRIDRRTLLIVTRTTIAALALVLATLIWVNLAPLPVILVLVGVAGIVWAFDLPARQAMAPQIVAPQARISAIAWLSTVMNSGRILGPAVGGVLLGIVGAAGCMLVSAAGFLIMAGFTSRMRPLPPSGAVEQRDIARDLLTGVRFVGQNPSTLALLLITTAGVVFWQAHIALLPVFARDVLGSGASGYGMLSAASGLGALAGALLVAAALPRRREGWVLAGLATAAGVLLPVWAGMTSFVPSMLLLLVASTFGAATQTLAASLLQREVPDDLQGRVMSVAMLTWGLTPIGLLLSGALADAGGAPFSVQVGSTIALVSTILVFLVFPGLRRL